MSRLSPLAPVTLGLLILVGCSSTPSIPPRGADVTDSHVASFRQKEDEQLLQKQVSPPLDAPLSLLIPSFILSEIQRAFEIGFLVYLPFLIIDLVVAAVLMSMGMMMVPPAAVALPFKLAFFVVADGWTLISSALVRSYF